jgi:REP element-mobilizing transposase RayT
VHIIFSTKNRARFIHPDLGDELHRYLAKVAREYHSPAPTIGGTEDHVHAVCSLGRTATVAELVQGLKTSTSKWIKTKGLGLRRFAWQSGYGAFSVGQSQLPRVKAYVARQQEHHRQKTFQEEFREFLKRYQIAYDERYVWD